PVLARVDNQEEIGWPFGVEEIERLLD
ncbi:MAG: hypothetical protein ACI8RO_001206, partial [Flavobacteriales bacterium]